jgi:hypothetical protein
VSTIRDAHKPSLVAQQGLETTPVFSKITSHIAFTLKEHEGRRVVRVDVARGEKKREGLTHTTIIFFEPSTIPTRAYSSE